MLGQGVAIRAIPGKAEEKAEEGAGPVWLAIDENTAGAAPACRAPGSPAAGRSQPGRTRAVPAADKGPCLRPEDGRERTCGRAQGG